MKILNKGFARLLGASILLVATSGAVQAAGDAAAGEQKAFTCLGCHGVKHYVNTYPTYHVPKLGGQHEAYLIAALKGYRSGERAHATMKANSALLSDQDIDDLAAYFASQGEDKVDTSDDREMPAAAATCSACHGADGNSPVPTNPVLAGQYQSYLEQALKSYRSKDRTNAIMSGFAAALSDDQIKELSAWFASHNSVLKTLEAR